MTRDSSSRDDDAAAVIGLAFEFPRCRDWDSLVALLRTGETVTGPMPPSRAELVGATPSEKNQEGGWMEDVAGFDHRHFGLARADAELMDPRQRRSLQLAVHAVENAGYAPGELRGRTAAVLVAGHGGPEPSLYHLLDERDRRHGAAITGSVPAFAAGRVSYLLDLRGSALVIDTACSSFLAALHEARQKLVRGEADLALVGGYEMVLGPPPPRATAADGLGVLSPQGRCRPFDESADGATFGEGGGFVLLKRHRDALRDRDVVHAVIRGSAVNQDAARSNGLTAPSPAAQADVIRLALADAGVEPRDIGYVEAHGTGTKIGDPIEVEGLTAAFGRAPGTRPIPISSVKGNLGHLNGMAGFAGLVRVVAQFREEEIFPTSGFRRAGSLLGLEGTGLRIADRAEPWPPDRVPRRAGISAFGLSGTNVHMIVEEGRSVPAAPAPGGPRLCALSAPGRQELLVLANRLRAQIAADPAAFPLDAAAATQAMGRDHAPCRTAWVVEDAAGLSAALDEFVRTGGAKAVTAVEGTRSVVLGMGDLADHGACSLDLLRDRARAHPAFAEIVRAAAAVVAAEQWTGAQRHAIRLIGEHAVLTRFGIVPDLVLAHGTGKAAAAVVHGTEDLAAALTRCDAAAATTAPDLDALEAALAELDAAPVVLDLAPGSALSGLLGTRPGTDSLQDALRLAYLRGIDIDWRAGLGHLDHGRLELPVTPFAEERCWPSLPASDPIHRTAGPPPDDAAAEPAMAAELVLEMACEVLKEPGLTLADDFFDVGGDSLNGVQLVTRVNERFGTGFEVLDLFDFATLHDLAEAVESTAPAVPATAASECAEDGEGSTSPGDGDQDPLSGQQSAIWAALQFMPGSSAYNVSTALKFDTEIDRDDVTRRLARVARRHPMMRARLREGPDGPRQTVGPPETADPELTLVEFDLTRSAEPEAALLDGLRELVDKPLRAYGAPPARYELVHVRTVDSSFHVLVLTFHHLFFDGHSWDVLLADLCAEEPPPPPERTFLDFVRDQRRMLSGERGARLTEFWAELLADVPLTHLPVDGPGEPSRPPGEGASLPLDLSTDLTRRLRGLARGERVTVNMLLLAVWTALLWKIGGDRDVCVATPVENRGAQDQDIIGCYANTVAVRVLLNPSAPFADLLECVRTAQAEALQHGDLPGDRIIRLARPTAAEPVATTNFGFQRTPFLSGRLGASGSAFELLDVDPSAPTFALNMSVLGFDDRLTAVLKYSTELFRPATARGWLADYRLLLTRLAELGTGSMLYELFEPEAPAARVPSVPDFDF
ncbi:beta-ketoacyl synthase N-terminal-like domain-containing protein [Actinomadura sp. 6K520]|uniref:beta-ketoacyl synthase N-terminal-like domain-containing protein n=1 Tax=Actinomadura sp. 6K520 TaxID=2530364 RepID=UPI0010448B05|nr:beta-ketoacyl synthase N-terminal-like domain-containing protein [Actinomadura sp. 6K520]TDE32827.1 polyketide synthase [Actinomadura sp. 6K520]